MNRQYAKTQLSQKHYWENFKIINHKYQFWIKEITVFFADIGYLRQTTKQPLSNFEPEKDWKYRGWGLKVVAYKKTKCSLNSIVNRLISIASQ